MFKSKILRVVFVLTILLMGGLLLFQSNKLTPETASRQEAVQIALAPGRLDSSNNLAAADTGSDLSMQQG